MTAVDARDKNGIYRKDWDLGSEDELASDFGHSGQSSTGGSFTKVRRADVFYRGYILNAKSNKQRGMGANREWRRIHQEGRRYQPTTKLKPGSRAIRQHGKVAGPVIRRPIVHRLDMRGEVPDETRANEQEEDGDH